MDLFNDTNDFIAENTRSYSVKFISTVSRITTYSIKTKVITNGHKKACKQDYCFRMDGYSLVPP